MKYSLLVFKSTSYAFMRLCFMLIIVFFAGCNSNIKTNDNSSIPPELDNIQVEPLENKVRNHRNDTIFYGFTSDMTFQEGILRLNRLVENDDNFVYQKEIKEIVAMFKPNRIYVDNIPYFQMIFQGKPFLFRVSLNPYYQLIGNNPSIIMESYEEECEQDYIQLISLHYSDLNDNPLNQLLDLYRRVYGNYTVINESKNLFPNRLPRMDGKPLPPQSLSERIGIENWRIYQWPSNPRVKIIYKNIRILKSDNRYDRIAKAPFTLHEIDVLYFSNLLLENMKLRKDFIKLQNVKEDQKKKLLEESLKDLI